MAHLEGLELELSPVCLGGNVFGWTADETQSFAVLDAYFEAGGNFIDTADMYGSWVPGNVGGESEIIIGKWMASRGIRDQVAVATKVAKYSERPGLSAANIRAACEDSLRRLQTDYIDLYYAHEDDTSVPLEETIVAFDDLMKDGMVQSLGASNFSADRLRESVELADFKGLNRYVALQPEYNLIDRDYEAELEPTCRDLRITTFPYYSLANGFLTGKYRPGQAWPDSVRSGRISQYFERGGEQVLRALDEVAASHSTSLTAIALAWLIAKPTVGAAIASARTVEQVTDLVASFDVKLSAGELERLDGATQ